MFIEPDDSHPFFAPEERDVRDRLEMWSFAHFTPKGATIYANEPVL